MLNAAKICFSNPEKNNLFVKCNYFFPSASQKKTLGELLFLFEIKLPEGAVKKLTETAEQITEIIVNGMRTNYYSKKIQDKEIEENFEDAIQKLNRLIYQETIGSKNFDLLIKKLNGVVALIYDERVYFSPVGSAQAFILKKNKIIDLASEESNYQPSKVFSQIISGDMEKDDTLFFSTANFLDYFVFEKINNIVQKNSADETVIKLKELLKNLKDKISTGALIIKKEKSAAKIATEEDTPSINALSVKEKNMYPSTPTPIKVEIEPEEKIIIKEKEPILPIKDLELKKEEKKSIFTPETHEKKEVKIELPTIQQNKQPERLLRSKPHLPIIKFSRIAIVVAIILVILGGYKIIDGLTSTKIDPKFLTAIQAAQEKNGFIQAALSYNDRKKAISLADALKKDIGALEPQTAAEKMLVDNLNLGFQVTMDKISNTQKIEGLNILANLGNGKFSVFAKQNTFFVFKQDSQEIYQLNSKTNKLELFAKVSAQGGSASGGKKSVNKIINYGDKELLLVENNGVEILNLENKNISALKIATNQKNFIITDIVLYEDKIYILNNAANQIFRYNKNNNGGFDSETAWLKDKVDLKNVIALTIDGSIYLLKNNGQIDKFYLGKKQTFALESIYPKLESAVKIITANEMKNLYLLDPNNQRIAIFDKTGKLQKQISADDFKDLKDLIISPDETKAWILNDAKIFEVDLKK